MRLLINRKGQVLVTVIIFMSAVLLLGIGLLTRTTSNIKQGRDLALLNGERSMGLVVVDLTNLVINDNYASIIEGALPTPVISAEGDKGWHINSFKNNLTTNLATWVNDDLEVNLKVALANDLDKDYRFECGLSGGQDTKTLTIRAESETLAFSQTMEFVLNLPYITGTSTVGNGYGTRLSGETPLVQLVSVE